VAQPSVTGGRDRLGPWIWSARTDLAVFAGSAALALTLVALTPWLAGEGGTLPAWGFLAFVIVVDVAHVYSTLFRTYLDGDEVRRRPLLYAGVPLGCFLVGAGLHAFSRDWFWRILAYVALFHFVRQQVGWVAVYRARAGLAKSRVDRVLDDAAIYAATLYPVAVWHASPPRAFHWFVEGDFFDAQAFAGVLPAVAVGYAVVLAAYVVRGVIQAMRGKVQLGKHVVVLTTVATWYVGIVATNSDFSFTVANVIVHGVPYVAFLWFYARERAPEASRAVGSRIVLRGGLALFCGTLLVAAFLEEMVWDRLVWRSHPQIFGGEASDSPLLSPALLAVVVPLLAVPQATHYVLDAVLWRRRDTGQAQARAMGFRGAPPAGAPVA
jgi:hypothetical protein